MPASLGSSPAARREQSQTVALTATGRPIGLLHIWGADLSRHDQELLHTFANHMALALERAQLREQAMRTELLEEVDRLQRALVGAVSHDLRTPLATIKASASTLRSTEADVTPPDSQELLELIDNQADRLDRLVTNLLDLSRVQAGALELRNEAIAVGDLVTDAMRGLGQGLTAGVVIVAIGDDLPLVDVDHLLIGQVLANLLDNAARHAPPDTAITVSAVRCATTVSSSSPSRTRALAYPGASGPMSFGCSTAAGTRAAPESACRSPRPSSRRTARRSGSRTHRPGAPASASRCRRRASPPSRALIGTGPCRRRRPGPASGPADRLSARSGTPCSWRPRASRASPRPPSARPTSSSSTSVCPTSTAWRCAGGSASGATCPIIVLSADGTEDRKIAALDGGADDYMTKPFGMGELEARLRVALRHRARGDGDDETKDIAVGPLELDLVHHEARMAGRARRAHDPGVLPSRRIWPSHAGKICTHRMILEHVWGPHYGTETQYLRVYVYRLRRKLGDDKGELIRTSPGVGYQLVDEEAL